MTTDLVGDKTVRRDEEFGVPTDMGPQSLRFQLGQSPDGLLERAMVGARRAVGSHGLVRRCFPIPAFDGVPRVPMYAAIGTKRNASGARPRASITGTGVSTEASMAWMQAIAEALERYCMVWPVRHERILRASWEQVADHAVPVTYFGLFSTSQYDRLPALHLPGPSDEIDWTWAWSLTNQRFVLVPAALAYATVPFRRPNNFAHGLSSTGVAAHVSLSGALQSAVLEVIERDALMISWFNKRLPVHVDLDEDIPAELRGLWESSFAASGYEFSLLDFTVDTGVPTIACLGRSSSADLPAAVFGAAARPDPVDAARKAMFEAAQVLAALHSTLWRRGQVLEPSDVRSFEDHARYYAEPQAASSLGFLTGSPLRTGLSTMPAAGLEGDALAGLVDRLAANGLEVLAVELTTPDVARCGFRVVKVLVPGTVDINADVRFPQLGAERITTAPRDLGWPSHGLEELNLAPCPLA